MSRVHMYSASSISTSPFVSFSDRPAIILSTFSLNRGIRCFITLKLNDGLRIFRWTFQIWAKWSYWAFT